MDERISRLQDRAFLDHADFLGVDYSSLYMCKSKRGMKREEGKQDAYKLPHRLIEKKRRDRINECIGQLKDLLPEHLKLTTLGHLEKAVVLELTLKHLNALTAVTEQQHQKILALQNGDRSLKSSIRADLDAFHSGFQACAKEVLKYLSTVEKWTSCEQRCTQLIEHLHKVLARLVQPQLGAQERDSQAKCVPVIQRTQNPEANENDTDTDSGYGGEADKSDARAEKACDPVRVGGVKIKQEFGDERVAKKPKVSWSENSGAGSAEQPNLAFMNSLMGMAGVGQQTPFCVPFYFINPSAAGSYMPFFDKSSLEKLVYPALSGPFPWLYPGITAHSSAAAAAAAAAAFPAGSLEKSLGFGAASKEQDCPSPLNEALHSSRVGASSPTDEEQNSDPDLNKDQQTQMKESSTTG
ncbi:class E basic helix-loop-helix protein 41 isoform X1 [Pangasianodon hypophthalmus]|uniref:class E basic helix-loop-helix protein 41 isoform X1 n=1 Tax=Pangasianodon hypophthalmus TaxID=310915 RepID=UPI002307E7E8|nr:class E basic helix-loop-helix protein 41 isoform X1 [Pangasianodon hypophthalmus]